MTSIVAPAASPEALAAARVNVRELLTQSAAFRALPPAQQQEIALHTVQVATYLAEPDGIRLPRENYSGAAPDAYSFSAPSRSLGDLPVSEAQASPRGATRSGGDSGEFSAVAAREGAAVAGALLQQVNFPTFVASLIQGVFHAIVESSIEQMEAYAQLVANVAKSLNQFRDENTTDNQGKDHLVEQFPDLFEISMSSDFDGAQSAQVVLREGVDESKAVKRTSGLATTDGKPVTELSTETIQEKLVPAARTQLATSRQQLLATMVLMGINRIVVTDGHIQAKVLYDFQARDNYRRNFSATKMDYLKGVTQRSGSGTVDSSVDGGSETESGRKGSDDYSHDTRNASYYSKGEYKWSESPVLKLMSIDQSQTDAALQTKASLAGLVDINFKSDYLELNKMADSFQIANIQAAAAPGGGARPPAGAGAPGAAGGSTNVPAAGTAAPATGGGAARP